MDLHAGFRDGLIFTSDTFFFHCIHKEIWSNEIIDYDKDFELKQNSMFILLESHSTRFEFPIPNEP